MTRDDLAESTMKALLATVADLRAGMPRCQLLELSEHRVRRLQKMAAQAEQSR